MCLEIDMEDIWPVPGAVNLDVINHKTMFSYLFLCTAHIFFYFTHRRNPIFVVFFWLLYIEEKGLISFGHILWWRVVTELIEDPRQIFDRCITTRYDSMFKALFELHAYFSYHVMLQSINVFHNSQQILPIHLHLFLFSRIEVKKIQTAAFTCYLWHFRRLHPTLLFLVIKF